MVVLLSEFYIFILVQIFVVVLFHRETTLSLHMSMWKIRSHFCLMLHRLLVDLHTRRDLIIFKLKDYYYYNYIIATISIM